MQALAACAVIFGPLLAGALLGRATQLPRRVLLLPALGLALSYWVAVGWLADIELGRGAAVLVTALLSLGWLLAFDLALREGRRFRARSKR